MNLIELSEQRQRTRIQKGMETVYPSPYYSCQFCFRHVAVSRDYVTTKAYLSPGRMKTRRGYLGLCLLGMCRWPLRAPTPLQSIFWPIIDIFVTLLTWFQAAECNAVSASLLLNLINNNFPIL